MSPCCDTASATLFRCLRWVPVAARLWHCYPLSARHAQVEVGSADASQLAWSGVTDDYRQGEIDARALPDFHQ